MPSQTRYFFCGIGGSGMLPLAMILRGQGFEVSGSDRSRDQGRTPEKFASIEANGIKLFPQDGSGLQSGMTLVISSAVEDSIPEVKKALAENIPILKRAELLASLFNTAHDRIAIAGTSGKSTTTGMLGFILHKMGKDPTVMNGAIFRNFATAENPFATALLGDKDLFVTEADESDGSIELYSPTVAVLNNISLDHKSIEELRRLFGSFIAKAKRAVLNLDNEEVRKFADLYREKSVTYSLHDKEADLSVSDIEPRADGIHCLISGAYSLNLNVPGRHNISNALAAIATVKALGFDIGEAVKILSEFSGVRRRMEVIGRKNTVTVIDDFAHNPDKIEASLQTLKEFPGRLLIMFQMHGFAPLKLMYKELAASFKKYLSKDDVIFMPEALYLGGTTERNYTAKNFIRELQDQGLNAAWFEKRDEILPALLKIAKPNDRVVIMGARDDTLSDFAKEVLASV